MAITKTWEINTMEREVSDGYVTKVIYRVKGISGSEEKARETGEIVFPTGDLKPNPLPDGFVDFTKLNNRICIIFFKFSNEIIVIKIQK